MAIPQAAILGAQLLGNLISLSQSAKANKRYDEYLKGMGSQLSGWFNRQYHQNYMDTPEAQSVLRNLIERQREEDEALSSSAAITGATPEKQIAQKERSARTYARTGAQLAGLGTQRKDRILSDYLGRKGEIDRLSLQNLLGKSQNWNQFGGNISSAAQNLLLSNMLGGDKIGAGTLDPIKNFMEHFNFQRKLRKGDVWDSQPSAEGLYRG